jgi:ABC-type polysaccharide/polyol phosphate transport system ATPase subunit
MEVLSAMEAHLTKKPSASITELLFSGDNRFHFKPTEKIILVGPNNSGKSQSLRDIVYICQNGQKSRTQVVVDLKLSKVGSTEDLEQFLKSEAD